MSPSEGQSPQQTGGNGSTAKVRTRKAGSPSQTAGAVVPTAEYPTSRLQELYDAATLEQLEALAAAPSVRQSRTWHAAVLARLTADVHDAAAVAGWTLGGWEDYFSKLEDYAPPSPAEAITAPLTAAVAHLRLFRTFQILLDPSKSAQHPKQPVMETLAPLVTAAVAAHRHRSPRMWLCVSAVDPHEFPSSHTAEQQWSEKVLNFIWEAAVTGACPCAAFFDPSGPLHDAAVAGGPLGERGAEEVTCMHVVLGGASGYTPGLARCLGRFMAAQVAILRLRAVHGDRAADEVQGAVAGAGGAAPGSAAVTAVELAELAAASHALAAEMASSKEAAELAAAAARTYRMTGGPSGFDTDWETGASAAKHGAGRGITDAIAALPWYAESHSYERLAAASLLRFSSYTTPRTPAAAALTVWIDVKNVGPVATMSVYHIDYEGWLRGVQAAGARGLDVEADIDLTAVTPSEVFTVATSGSQLMHERLEVVLPNTRGRRGTVVVDATAGGHMCRAVIRRGSLQCMQRTTIAGHAFALFYEDGSTPAAPALRMDGRYYTPQAPPEAPRTLPATTAAAATDRTQAPPSPQQVSAHEIFVPFPAEAREVVATLCDGGTAVSAARVHLDTDSYALTMADSVLDPMALVPGVTVSIPVRARLTLNGAPAPLSLLHNVRLTVTTTDMHGAEATAAAENFTLRELPHAAVHALKVPEGCRRVAVVLSATVTCMAPGPNGEPREVKLQQSTARGVATADSTDAVAAAHLSLTPGGGAVIQVLGRCGEAIPEAAVTVMLKHRAWRKPAKACRVQTDGRGCIAIDCVADLHWLTLSGDDCPALGHRLSRTWHLDDLFSLKPAALDVGQPAVLEAGEGNWLAVPLEGAAGAAMLQHSGPKAGGTRNDATRAVADVVLVSITDCGRPLRRHPVRINAGCVRVAALHPGRYRLDIHPTRRSLQILVVPPPRARGPRAPPDVIVGPHTVRKCRDGMLPLSLLEPLHVQQFTCTDKDGIRASVGGGCGRRVVCITLARFVGVGGGESRGGWRACSDGVCRTALNGGGCKFQAGMEMGDEVRYVHDRRSGSCQRAARTLPLDKPSLLTHPVKAGATENVDLQLKPAAAGFGHGGAGAAVPRARGSMPRMCARRTPLCRLSKLPHADAEPGLQFCGPALVLSNAAVADNGTVHVPAELLPPGWALGFSTARLEVFCADGSSAAADTHVSCDPHPDASARPCMDPRAGRRLPPGVPHICRKETHACAAGDILTVDNAHIAKVTVIGSMHDVHALITALLGVRHPAMVAAAQTRTLSSWEQFPLLGDWETLPIADKLKALEEKACYELFIFLRFADQAFFEEHVRPLLAQRAASEQDTMTLILTGHKAGLRARMRDMSVVSRMTALEVLLTAAELGDAAMLRAVARRWEPDESLSELRKWDQKRFDVALAHGALSTTAAAPNAEPEPEPPRLRSLPGGAADPATGAASHDPVGAPAALAQDFGGAGEKLCSASWPSWGLSASSSDIEELEVEEQPARLMQDMLLRREAVVAAKEDFAFESTRTWREAGYWEDGGEKILGARVGGYLLGPFWADYAAHLLATSSDRPADADAADRLFLSRNIHTAAVDFTTAAVAAGLIARTFQNIPSAAAGYASSWEPSSVGEAYGPPTEKSQHTKHEHVFDGCCLRLTAASPFFAFTREVVVQHRVNPETPVAHPIKHTDPGSTQAAPLPSTEAPSADASAAFSQMLGYMCVLDPKDPTITDGSTGERSTKVATGPFLVHRVYTLRVILSNPTADERQVEVVVPCPGSAVAVGGGSFVDMREHKVAPFACVQHEVNFYFPEVGEYVAPIASILRRERLALTVQLNGGAPMKVVSYLPPMAEAEESLIPGSSAWLLSAYAPDTDVLAAVAAATHTLPVQDLTWRCKRSVDFHRALLAVLRAAGQFDERIWVFSLLHGDTQGILEWLAGSSGMLTSRVGVPFNCGSAQIGREANGLRLREFWPLVNPRAHKLAGAPALVCPQLQTAWRAFLTYACRAPTLSAEELLEAACFMAAMDRLQESGDLLRRADTAAAAATAVEPHPSTAPGGAPATEMQRDYLWAFLTLSNVLPGSPERHAPGEVEGSPQHDQLASVAAVVLKHTGRIAAGRWATLWAEMAAYVSELQARHADAAAGSEAMDVEDSRGAIHEDDALPTRAKRPDPREKFLALDDSEAQRGRVNASTPAPAHNRKPSGGRAGGAAADAEGGAEWLEVAFREVDIEVAFSTRPFERLQDGGGVAVVLPTWRARVLIDSSGTTKIDLTELSPDRRLPCGVAEVRYRGLREEAVVVAHHLTLQLQAERGVVAVLAPRRAPRGAAAVRSAGRAPVEGAYVKVFARVNGSSQEKFWRDGYTDSLGRLEYARSTSSAASVQRFSLLVVADGHGACIAQVDAPTAVRCS